MRSCGTSNVMSQNKMEIHPNVQDWHPVTLTKHSKSSGNKRAPGSFVDQNIARARKAETETEDFTIKTVSKSAATEIIELRTKKGWTQKQLAQAINERPDVVKSWENGTAIPNGQLLVKMRRALK